MKLCNRITLQSVMVCALLLASGCASQKGKGQILYSEGCVFYVDSLSSVQAADIMRDWSMEDCKIVVRSASGDAEEAEK